LPAASANKSNVKSDVLLKAVYQAVGSNKSKAPEIVCAAMGRSRGLGIHKEIIRTAITALGDPKTVSKGAVASIVSAAIGCSNCKDKAEEGNANAGCECAEQFTQVAIEALGPDISEELTNAIVVAAIEALNGRCADGIVNAASRVAPQHASAIADAGARAGRGNGNGLDNENNPNGGDGIVFNPTGRPVPAPFVLPPAGTNGGALVDDTTPVK
jgi:hypothetical protein